MEPEAIKKINKYDVVDVIGRGGMGVVYKAIDRTLDRLVAIKMVTTGADDPDSLLKRFYREAQFTGNLRHINIVTVYDLGDFEGRPYLVMEYLDGSSLESLLATESMTLLQKISYVRQVCNGLEYAHTRQPSIVHRDIKPANIVVLKDGTVKIIDFGIARLGHSRNTRSGQLLGSYHYMSPEQINDAELDGRTDIFSTGVVLYQLLTQRLPFEGSGVAQILNKIVNSPAAPLRQFLQDYPPALDGIMALALAKNRDERYRSASEFAFDLLDLEEQLKRELFGNFLAGAEKFLQECEYDQARQELLQVLKVDHQHPRANELLRQVQQAIAKQQRKERVHGLRVHAEQALQQRDVAEALTSVEQAVRLDSTNLELKAFRDRVLEIHGRAEKLNEILGRAERAYAAQDYERASRALDEALVLDPEAPRAKSFKGIVDAKLVEREKDRQVEALMSQARRQIALRKFTGALELLRDAEKLDPEAASVRDLIALAEPAYEQEVHRKAVEQASVEINEALDRSDPALARDLADRGLAKLPGERSLLQLKAIAEQQIEVQRRRGWVAEQMTAARNLLDSRKSADALALLEAAAKQYPGEGDLESLILIVRAAIQREQGERRRAEYLTRAQQALRRKDYSEAIATLEAARSEVKSNDFDELLQFAKEEAAQAEFQSKVDAAASQAQVLLDSGDYEQAVAFLQAAVQDLPDHDLRILEASARRQLADFRKSLEQLLSSAEQLLAQGRAGDAVTCLEAQRASYHREPRFHAALQEACRRQETEEAIEKAISAIRNLVAAGDYDTAERQLAAAREKFGDSSQWQRLESNIRSERSTSLETQTMETALSDAEALLRSGADAQALATLESTGHLVDKVPDMLRARFDDLKTALTGRLRVFTAPRTKKLPDQSVLELTPPEGVLLRPAPTPQPTLDAVNTALSKTESAAAPEPRIERTPQVPVATPGWADELLREVEKQLAVFIGPVAKVMVHQAASHSSDLQQLYSMLAAGLDTDADRRAFLARRGELKPASKLPPRQPAEHKAAPATPAAAAIPAASELTPAAVDRASRILAHFLGPISGVLARKAMQRADNVRAFYLLLAEHLENPSERARFLRDAGFPDA